MKDLDRFVKNLTGLAETLREPTLSEFRIETYRRALDPFDDDAIEAAIFEAGQTNKFFPKPVELLDLMQGSDDSRCLEAWEHLEMAISRHGANTSILFTDGRISRVVVAMGGWLEVCNWLTDEMKFHRKEFMRLYAATRKNDEQDQQVLYGRHDIDNLARGYPEMVQSPMIIGEHPVKLAIPRKKSQALLTRCAEMVLKNHSNSEKQERKSHGNTDHHN